MVLAVDVGNTNIVLGGYCAGKLAFCTRLTTDKNMEPDPYALQLRGILELYGVAPDSIEGIILSSVVPQLTHTLEQALARFTGVTPLRFDRSLHTGVTIDIENPDELGADLLAGAAAAKAGYELPAIVVDLGTATKLTAIDANGRVLGASIMPGVFISLNALVSGASLLGAVALQTPKRAIGRNSAQSMQSGVVFGAASMLDGMVARFEAEMGPAKTLLATGGAAGLIVPHCQRPMLHVPTLLLDGLYAVYRMNV